MGFAPLSDDFFCHPKVIALGKDADAIALYALALSWSTSVLSDGMIPRKLPARLLPEVPYQTRDRMVRALCRVTFWEVLPKCEGIDDYAWQIHNFLRWQKSHQQINEIRVEKRRVGSLGGLAKTKRVLEKTASTRSESALPNSEAMSEAMPEARPEAMSEATVRLEAIRMKRPGAPPATTRIEEVAHATGSDSEGTTPEKNRHAELDRYREYCRQNGLEPER
jgi:hypothetical protein